MDNPLLVATGDFVDIVEKRVYHQIIWVMYSQYDGNSPNETKRLSFENAVLYLASSARPRLSLVNPSTPQHMEHIRIIVNTCTQFEQVNVIARNEVDNSGQILNFIIEKSLENKTGKICIKFTKNAGFGVGRLEIECQPNGIHWFLKEADSILLLKIKEFQKYIVNQNKSVEITVEDMEFEELFEALGWQHMDENLEMNRDFIYVPIENDSNTYYISNGNHEDMDEVDSGISDTE